MFVTATLTEAWKPSVRCLNNRHTSRLSDQWMTEGGYLRGVTWETICEMLVQQTYRQTCQINRWWKGRYLQGVTWETICEVLVQQKYRQTVRSTGDGKGGTCGMFLTLNWTDWHGCLLNCQYCALTSSCNGNEVCLWQWRKKNRNINNKTNRCNG